MGADQDQQIHAALLARLAIQQGEGAAHEAEAMADVAALFRDDDADSVPRELTEALVSTAAQAIAALQAYGPVESADSAAITASLAYMAEARKRLAVAELVAVVAGARIDTEEQNR